MTFPSCWKRPCWTTRRLLIRRQRRGSDICRILHPSAVGTAGEADSPAPASRNGTPSWLTQSADPYVMAKEALAAGHEDKAFAIMRGEIARQRSGRGRFRRTMQLIELVVSSGKDAIAQPLLDDVTAMIENHKLDAWEEPEQVAS